MTGRLDLYVARYFISSGLVSLVFFLGLFSVYDFFAHVDDLMESRGVNDASFLLVGRLYLLQTPGILLKVAPFIVVMAALVAVMRLQRHNEFMAMVMTGRSPRRILRPLFGLTGVFVLVLVWVQESVAPNVALERDRLQAQLFERGQDWIIDSVTVIDASGRTFVAQSYNVNRETIGRLSVSYRDRFDRNVHVQGEEATWDPGGGGWRLKEGVSEVRRLDTNDAPIVDSAAFVRTDIRPEDLLVDSREPFDLAYGDVLDLSSRYPNSRRYRLLRHYHVTFPLSVLLLVLLALPFVLRHGQENRLKGLGVSVLLCLGFKIVDATVWDLGSRGVLQPVLAAWLPVLVAGSLATVLFDSLER